MFSCFPPKTQQNAPKRCWLQDFSGLSQYSDMWFVSRNRNLLVQYLLDVHGKTRAFSLFSKAGFESRIYPVPSHHPRKNQFSTVKVTGVFTCIVALR